MPERSCGDPTRPHQPFTAPTWRFLLAGGTFWRTVSPNRPEKSSCAERPPRAGGSGAASRFQVAGGYCN